MGVYFAAVISSIAIGLGTKRLLNPFANYFTGAKGLFMNFIISFLAVGSAGCANVMLMRSKEMTDGITLKDDEGNEVGKSKIVGKKAVIQTGLTRYIIPLVPLLFPTLIFYGMEKRHLIPKNKAAKMMLESCVFAVSLAYAPAMGIALFAPQAKI